MDNNNLDLDLDLGLGLEPKENENDTDIEISKVKLPNGEVYNFKDQYIRDALKELIGDLGK